MLTLDITNALGKTITPSFGIPDQELDALRTTMKRYTENFLSEREKGEHAWSMDPYNKETIELTKDLASRIKAERIRSVVWIGIGGSGLAPKVIRDVFESPNTVEFHVLDTLDPAMVDMTLNLVDWKKTLVVIASKSGGTLETMSLFFLCWEKLKNAMKEKAPERVVGITDPKSGHLRSFCLEHGIPMLPISTDVGGRYSVFTPIGLLPLALLNADIDEFIRGAKEMDTVCQQTSIDDNPASLLAAVQFLLDTKKGYPIRVIMPYSQRLESIGRWNQQLISESLGKTETQNPIPVAAIGTQDQHSLLQQWMEGPRKSWHLFIKEDKKKSIKLPEDLEEEFTHLEGKEIGDLLDACDSGTSTALARANRPNVTITLPSLHERFLGELFFLLMTEVVLLGKLYRIDPYGQPGVEVGKEITKSILSDGDA